MYDDSSKDGDVFGSEKGRAECFLVSIQTSELAVIIHSD